MFYNVAEAEFEIKRLQDCCQSYRVVIERLQTALKLILNEKVDYMLINKLGDPETQHTVRLARAALAETDPAIPSREGDGGADKPCEITAIIGNADMPVCPVCDHHVMSGDEYVIGIDIPDRARLPNAGSILALIHKACVKR